MSPSEAAASPPRSVVEPSQAAERRRDHDGHDQPQGEAGNLVDRVDGDLLRNGIELFAHSMMDLEVANKLFWQGRRNETRGDVVSFVRWFDEFIKGWHNPHRRYSGLGYLSPADFERRMSAA